MSAQLLIEGFFYSRTASIRGTGNTKSLKIKEKLKQHQPTVFTITRQRRVIKGGFRGCRRTAILSSACWKSFVKLICKIHKIMVILCIFHCWAPFNFFSIDPCSVHDFLLCTKSSFTTLKSYHGFIGYGLLLPAGDKLYLNGLLFPKLDSVCGEAAVTLRTVAPPVGDKFSVTSPPSSVLHTTTLALLWLGEGAGFTNIFTCLLPFKCCAGDTFSEDVFVDTSGDIEVVVSTETGTPSSSILSGSFWMRKNCDVINDSSSNTLSMALFNFFSIESQDKSGWFECVELVVFELASVSGLTGWHPVASFSSSFPMSGDLEYQGEFEL